MLKQSKAIKSKSIIPSHKVRRNTFSQNTMTPCLVSDRSLRLDVATATATTTTTTRPGHVGQKKNKNKKTVEQQQLLLLPLVERESPPPTTSLLPTSSPPRRRRSRNISESDSTVVSFAPTVSVREVLHLEDYTEEEIRNTWYQKNEYSMIKADANLSVWMMEQQNLQEQQQQQQQQEQQEEQIVLDDESTSSSSSSSSSMSVSSSPSSSSSPCHCYRGLECRTKRGIAIKNRIRQQSQFAVLDVQRLVVSLSSSLTTTTTTTSSSSSSSASNNDEEATTSNNSNKYINSNNKNNISKMMEEEIAMAYQEYTKSCQERAHILALQDMSDIDENE